MSYGKVIVCSAQGTTSDTAYAIASDTVTFVANVLNWFTSKPSSNFLVSSLVSAMSRSYSFGTQFQTQVQNMGHRLTFSESNMISAHQLDAYDGVFLEEALIPAAPLQAYISGGGCVYLCGGEGTSDSFEWNRLLNQFGLSFGAGSNGIVGGLTISSSHPLFRGVSEVYVDDGTWLSKTAAYFPDSQVIGHTPAQALFGVVQLTGMVVQPVWEDSVIKIEWAVDPNGSFDCNPNAPNLNQDVLGSFPGWFKVTNKVNLPLTNVSIQINVNENARTWDVSLKDHDLNDENDQTVILGNLPANGTQSAPTNFKWQVRHTGVRFQWDSFNVNFSLTPEYTVSYTPGWGPSATVNAVPHQVG